MGKKTGVLDKDEAATFFGHLVSEEKVPADQRESVKAQIQTQIEEAKKQVNEMADGKAAEYAKDKKAKDDAAFKIIDTSGDGSIQKDEFIAALDPSNKKNDAFMKALGFDVDMATGAGAAP